MTNRTNQYTGDIHRFRMQGLNLVLDVNSGAVHVMDEAAFSVMEVYDGTNEEMVLEKLTGLYSQEELKETLAELRAIIDAGRLFSPAVEVPATFFEKPLVKSLCLHVAHDCNLRCGYCFAGTGDFGHGRGLMTKEVGEKAIEFVIENSGPRKFSEIDFFGGEPLLNMEVVRHVTAYARKREKETGKVFRLTLTTNGVLLTDEIREFLNRENIALVLSLDGRKEVHDYMRPCADGSGSFDEALAAFQKTVESRNHTNYYLRGTFTAHNLDFCADVLAMADMGFRELSVEPVVTKDPEYALTEKHLPGLYQEYEKLAAAYLERQRSGNGFHFFHFHLDLDNGPCVPKRLSGCGAGHEYFAVTPEGDLYPCHQFVGREEFRLGDVYQGIGDTKWPQKFKNCHVLAKEACRNCWARFHCSGGCHANAHAFSGKLEIPYEIGCQLQKKRLECAIMIQAQLALEQQNS